jgi:hypothetical protein
MSRAEGQGGFVVVVLVLMLVPVLLLVGSFTTAMVGKSNELRTDLDSERALLCAESGVDEAVFRGQTGTLSDGVPFSRDLGGGLSYTALPTHLLHDKKDNDGDKLEDEPDEDVFQIEVTGTYRNTVRRVAAYLGPVQLLPPINSAFTLSNPGETIELKGTPLISGNNVTMSGAPASPSGFGLGYVSPATEASVLGQLSGTEQALVVGASPAPSIGAAGSIDVPALVAQMSNYANIVLTSDKYTSYSFGNGPAGIANIAYRNGDVTFGGNTQGAGILAVNGNLTLGGTFRFDGVILVTGNIESTAGTARIYGAILQGPAGSFLQFKGTVEIHYSSEAIALANSASGQYVSFNGWQELAR